MLAAFGYTQNEYQEDIGYIMRNNGVAMMEAHEIFKERLNFLIYLYKSRGLVRKYCIDFDDEHVIGN